MKNDTPKAAKKRPGKWETAFNIGGAAAAVGLLAIHLFVSPEQLTGPTFLHGIQIFLVFLAVVCACGLAYWAMKNIRNRKAGKQK